MFRHAPLFFHTFPAIAFFYVAPSLCAVSVATISSGPYPVGSTNFEVSSLSTAEMEKRLIGSYTTTSELYISDILLHAADCPSFDVDMPANGSLFGRHSGKSVHFVAYVLYPTTDDNLRPDYVFPYTNTGDHTFPHMQRQGEAPIFRDSGARYPLIIYSHGYNAHGLWDLAHMKLLASQGYIVAAIQHGDGRNSTRCCVSERPLAVSALLDHLLADSNFGPAIDVERIGMSGSSFGGCTTLAVIGGGCFSSSLVPSDSRFRAGFGIVPYVGGYVNPFGASFNALAGVKCPFFAVYAQNDKNALKAYIEAALPKIQGTCAGVILAGETHGLSDAANVEAQTYEIYFFNSWLRDDKNAMATLYGDMTVEGGVDDTRTYQHVVDYTEVDADACFGNCPRSRRLYLSVFGSKIRVVFPASTDTSIRYDVMQSADFGDWQCLRFSVGSDLSLAELPAFALPEGFGWRVVEIEKSLANLEKPLFLRIRISQ
jgi:hypothetical protein